MQSSIGLLATQHNYMTSAALEITSENSISKNVGENGSNRLPVFFHLSPTVCVCVCVCIHDHVSASILAQVGRVDLHLRKLNP